MSKLSPVSFNELVRKLKAERSTNKEGISRPHGDTEKEALHSLGEAIKEYLLTAVEENAMDVVYDSAQNKYWRMFNEIEAKTTLGHIKRSLTKSKTLILDHVQELKLDIQYA